jgi:putative nucleotidyltransferase-like protein
MTATSEFQSLIETLKLAVACLRKRKVPFALGGSLAAWARGGPVTQNDLDLMVKPDDAELALSTLSEAGMRPERPPEEWLYKAWHDDVLIDLIFRPSGLEITDEVLARADVLPVMAVATPVMALEDVLVTMLCSLDEHRLDYSRLVAIVRSLREQIDWPSLRGRTDASPYARAFFTLVEGLGIASSTSQVTHGGSSRVRVIDGGAA